MFTVAHSTKQIRTLDEFGARSSERWKGQSHSQEESQPSIQNFEARQSPQNVYRHGDAYRHP